MAHKGRVLQYLKEHGSITSKEAFDEFGETRLSAVIFELRKDGLEIETERVKGVNRFGERTNYGKYFLRDAKGVA